MYVTSHTLNAPARAHSHRARDQWGLQAWAFGSGQEVNLELLHEFGNEPWKEGCVPLIHRRTLSTTTNLSREFEGLDAWHAKDPKETCLLGLLHTSQSNIGCMEMPLVEISIIVLD